MPSVVSRLQAAAKLSKFERKMWTRSTPIVQHDRLSFLFNTHKTAESESSQWLRFRFSKAIHRAASRPSEAHTQKNIPVLYPSPSHNRTTRRPFCAMRYTPCFHTTTSAPSNVKCTMDMRSCVTYVAKLRP